jgi:hypothetical protein
VSDGVAAQPVCCAGAPQDHDSGDQREDHDAGRTGFRLAVDRASHPLRRIVADPGASIALPLGNKERDPAREQGGVAGDVGWWGERRRLVEGVCSGSPRALRAVRTESIRRFTGNLL